MSLVLSSVTDGSGAIQKKEFHTCVADTNESRARITKSERFYHEERANVKKRQKGDLKGKCKGRGGKDASAGDP